MKDCMEDQGKTGMAGEANDSRVESENLQSGKFTIGK